jgi:hypothetical protein
MKPKVRDAIGRAMLGTAGGYVCAMAFMAFMSALLSSTGLINRGEAVIYSGIFSLVVWLLMIIAAFLLPTIRSLLSLMTAIIIISTFVFFLLRLS